MRRINKIVLACVAASVLTSSLVSSSYARRGGSTLQTQMNQIAAILKMAVDLEKANWNKSSFAMNTAFDNLKTEFTTEAVNLDSTSLANSTGIVTVTLKTGTSIAQNVRGLIVVIQPYFMSDDGDLTAFSEREAASSVDGEASESQRSITTYKCTLTNTNAASSKTNFKNVNILGKTRNVISSTESAARLAGNPFASYCSGATVVIS
jgi:hypothetical protein